MHISILVILPGLVNFIVLSILYDTPFAGVDSFLSTLPVSILISSAILLPGVFYTILLVTKRSLSFQRKFLQQALFAMTLIIILYIYGEGDRFVFSNPKEDLLDFSFVVFLVLTLWALTTFVFSFFKKKFSSLKKPVYLLLRGLTLVTLIIPLDVLLNYLFLDLVYDLPLYEDYWVLEVPFKIMIGLLVNFLDEAIFKSLATVKKNAVIKVKSGSQYRFIAPEQIGYFLVQNQICYAYTITGEKHITDLTLTQLESELDAYHFFRASRQLLVAREAIEGYRSAEGKKIELTLSGIENTSQTHYISRLSAPFFRKWINNELGTIQS